MRGIYRLLAALLIVAWPAAAVVQTVEAVEVSIADEVEAEPIGFDVDSAYCDSRGCDVCWRPVWCDFDRIPGMMGDYFGGTRNTLRGNFTLDRLMVPVNDLDAPTPLPAGNSVLTITEAGPVGIFSTSVQSAQEIQQILRSGGTFPGAVQVGVINSNGTLTTALTVSQIQSLLASTPEAFDIIPVAAPPGSYRTAVDQTFQNRNPSVSGATQFDASGSGAFLQGGTDTLAGGEDLDAFYFYNYVVAIDTQLAGAGTGGLGRAKIAEGASPLPRDRAFFDYGYFSVLPSNAGRSLNRFTPGIEKTFLQGMVSLEARFPFASQVYGDLASNGNGITNSGDTVFGNISLYGKVLLYQHSSFALSAGLGVILPTAGDTSFSVANGVPLAHIDNDAVYLQPFLGFVWLPSHRSFVQGFLQTDLAASGNDVMLNSTGNGLTHVGKLTDANHLFADLGVGYWLYRNDCGRVKGLTGFAPIFEMHYTGAVSSGDIVSAGPFQIGSLTGDLNMLNYVAGCSTTFGSSMSLSVGYTGPLSGGNNRQFSDGFRALVEYRPR